MFVVVLLFLIVRHVKEARLGHLVWPSGGCCERNDDQPDVAAPDGAPAAEPATGEKGAATEATTVTEESNATKTAVADKEKPKRRSAPIRRQQASDEPAGEEAPIEHNDD